MTQADSDCGLIEVGEGKNFTFQSAQLFFHLFYKNFCSQAKQGGWRRWAGKVHFIMNRAGREVGGFG